MQFDWLVQCYPGVGVHRDAPLLDDLDRETTMAGVDAVEAAGIEGLWAPDHFMLGPKYQEYLSSSTTIDSVYTHIRPLTAARPVSVGPLPLIM